MESHQNAKELIRKLDQYDISIRQNLITSYAENIHTYDDPAFWGELLSNEKDSLCKWYEIRALGDLKAIVYKKLLVDLIVEPDISFDTTSLHSIIAYSLGKMKDESVIDLLLPLLESSSENIIKTVLDIFGELKSAKAIPHILPFLKKDYTSYSVYAGLALGKIGNPSVTYINNIFDGINEKNQLVLLDALMMINDVDSQKEILYIFNKYQDLSKAILKNPTKSSTQFVDFLNRSCAHDSLTKELLQRYHYLTMGNCNE